MNFGLDWDGTVNQAYALWAIWTREAIRAGHRVYVVTMRYPSEVDDYMRRWCFNNGVHSIVTTARGPKRPAMERLGLRIDVWIDDNPRAVEEYAANIWGAATQEGEVVTENANAAHASTPLDLAETAQRRILKLEAENFALAAGQCCEPEGGLTADEGGTPYCAMKRDRDRLLELLEQECADIDKIVDAFHLRPQMFRTEGGRLRVEDLAHALRLMSRPNG